MASTSPTSPRWLFGPVPDLLLGCGLLYGVVFAIFAVGGAEVRTFHPFYLLPLLTILISMPHYGATLLRVYDRREDRRSYAVFSVYATVAVFAAFVGGVYHTGIAAGMLTLYLTWSPWHYTGQNYGIGVLFLRRRGVDLTPPVKRLVYASFLISFLLTFLVMHTASGTAADVPVPYSGEGIRFRPLGIPSSVSDIAIPILALAGIGSFFGWIGLLLRRASLRDLAPTIALSITQALWFSVPLAVRYWGIATGIEPLDSEWRTYYFLWIALGHAVQYVWVTTYYAKASRGWHGIPRYLSKTLLAGAAIWTLPVIAFGPETLGRLEYSDGLALLVASAVNVHHFILDGAIWKLRNTRIANVLIRSAPDSGPETASAASPERTWVRRAVWSTAAGLLAAALFGFWAEQIGTPSAFERGDLDATSSRLDALAWIGMDDSAARQHIGDLFIERGDHARAIEQYDRTVALSPNVRAYDALVRLRGSDRDWRGAANTFERASEQRPDDVELLFRTGIAWIRLEQPERALPPLERAAALEPGRDDIRRALVRARRMNAGNPGSDPPEIPR